VHDVAACADNSDSAITIQCGVCVRCWKRPAIGRFCRSPDCVLSRPSRIHSRVTFQAESFLQLSSQLKSIDTKWCDTCYIEEDPFEKIAGDAESNKDREKWQQNTETKALELVKILDDLNPKGMTAQEKKTHDHIEESKKLLRLYKMIKDKAMEVMVRTGIEVQLPSEQGTYVDASGKQWENAEPSETHMGQDGQEER